MKNNSFDFLDKYKYIYFVLVGLLCAFLVSFILQLFDSEINAKLLLNRTFFYWGFMYPVGFVIYEAIKKQQNNNTK